MKYQCQNVYMLRTPALPIEFYLDWDKYGSISDIIYFIKKNDIESYFKESFLISSRDLFEAMNRFGKDEKSDYKAYETMTKYVIRSTTRPTPYGTYARVALGEFNKTKGMSNLIINKDFCKREVKIDMQWSCQIIHELKKNHCIIFDLQTNNNDNDNNDS